VFQYRNSENAATAESANTFFYEALNSRDAGKLQEVAKQFPDGKMAIIASLMAADMYLNEGSDQQYMNRDAANTSLGNASDLYQDLIPKLKDGLLAQAKFGLARTNECRNKLREAEKDYAEVVDRWPDSPYGVLASKRLADLKRTSTKELYDNFAKAETPKPNTGDSLLRGKGPTFDQGDMPKEPIYTPSFEDKLKDSAKKQELPLGVDLSNDKAPTTDETPATEEKKPDAAAPAGTDQPAAPPATEEKPATPEEKPSEPAK
jgi:hypothetical protein